MIIIEILLVLFFLLWTWNVKRENLTKIDDKVYEKVIFKDIKTNLLKVLTNLASYKFFVLLLFILLFIDKKWFCIYLCLLIIDAIIIWVVKHILKRERPTIKPLVKEKGYSYPSGHTTTASCFYGFLIYLVSVSSMILTLKIVLIISLIFLIFLIGYSRIYLGVHYFSDVIGGLLFGTCYTLIYVYFIHFLLNII